MTFPRYRLRAVRLGLQLRRATRRGHPGEQIRRPQAQPLKTLGHRLLELHVGLDLAFRRVAHGLGLRARSKNAVPGQDAVLQVHVQPARRRVALRADDAGRFAAHFRLREVQDDHAAVDELGAGAMAGVGDRHGVVGMNQRAVLEHGVGHWGIVFSHPPMSTAAVSPTQSSARK